MSSQEIVSLLGYDILAKGLETSTLPPAGIINTINPHSYCVAKKDLLFREALQKSTLLLPDGVGIVLAAKILIGKKITRVTGSDLHTFLLNEAEINNWKLFYLGSNDDTLKKIISRVHHEHPSVKISTYSPPYKPVFSREDSDKMISAINLFAPDILFVGMTAPKQEKWVYQNKSGINANLICSIGAVFDFYTDTVKRAPMWMQKAGIEWIYRSLVRPASLGKRNLFSNPEFLMDLILIKLKLIR